MPFLSPMRAALFALAFGLLATGCVPALATQQDRRYPDRRDRDARSARVERTVAVRAVRARVARDAGRYVAHLDRALRLNNRQERHIRNLLADRAFERVRRARGRDLERAYPFPRRAEDRASRKWWKKADRRIERVLDRRQRRAYKRLVRDHFERARHDRRDQNKRGRNGKGWGGGED